MIIRSNRDKEPNFSHTVRGAEDIVITGDVTLGENVSVWYGCILRGDGGPISVGDNTNLQDGCIVHEETSIGRDVAVGHRAILHGCTVENNCLIGMGAILLDGCVIGEGSIVAAGALVPEGKIIPPGSLAIGIPAKVLRPLTEEEKAKNQKRIAAYIEKSRESLPLLREMKE